ncbi:tyrosine-type recombinase/integrase [Amycolatopsis echigonensis]|uniref:tyrosine-type recombinase/integrase n=1 Tax=Amycolatopsis echigonensis TaxID=2576905 RepID=UPI001FE7F4A7|nr:site-specific integrase [Amycolatopsis echigonensis]
MAASPPHQILLVYTVALLDRLLSPAHEHLSPEATADDRHNTSTEMIAAAKTLIATMGLSPADLAEATSAALTTATFAEYVPKALKAATPSSARTWRIYLNILADEWPDRRLDEPTPIEIANLVIKVQERSILRKASRGGHGARANFIDAVRFLYRCALADKVLAPTDSPLPNVRRPPKRKSLRRALTSKQLAEINEAAATTGRDTALDCLVIRLHTEMTCRRGGAIALRPCDLEPSQLTVRLREKGSIVRDQPVSPTLMAGLLSHVEHRSPNGDPTAPLFVRANSYPLDNNYYQNLWKRIGGHLPWVKNLGVTAHWLRYTTLTWVERNFGYAVAAGYAGHIPVGSRAGNTLTCVAATLEERLFRGTPVRAAAA